MRRHLTRSKKASGLAARCTRPTASLRKTTTAKTEIRSPPIDNVKPGTGTVANVVVSNATKTPAGTLAEKVAVAVEAKDSSSFCLPGHWSWHLF